MRALAIVLVLAQTAHAEPPTKLGFRLGVGRIPLADSALQASQVAIGVEHPVFGRLRMFAEYEWLWLAEVPEELEMPATFTGMGHRTDLGFRRAFATKRVDVVTFYADVEAGGGLGFYDTPAGGDVLPHGFVSLRAGYQLALRGSRASRMLETELHLRAIVVEHGVGFGGGLGFYWGD